MKPSRWTTLWIWIASGIAAYCMAAAVNLGPDDTSAAQDVADDLACAVAQAKKEHRQ